MQQQKTYPDTEPLPQMTQVFSREREEILDMQLACVVQYAYEAFPFSLVVYYLLTAFWNIEEAAAGQSL